MAQTAAHEALSPVERLEILLHPWVGFTIMPLFALANAGVPISFGDVVSPVALAVFVGLAFGKPVGVLAFSWLAVRSGIAIRASDVSWDLLAGGALLAGIGSRWRSLLLIWHSARISSTEESWKVIEQSHVLLDKAKR